MSYIPLSIDSKLTLPKLSEEVPYFVDRLLVAVTACEVAFYGLFFGTKEEGLNGLVDWVVPVSTPLYSERGPISISAVLIP